MKDRREDIIRDVESKLKELRWVKLVGLGNVGSGKTCLIKYFCENKFAPGYQPTVAVDYGFKIETINKADTRVHLWDLSGSDDYYETRVELYHATDGVFITFDVTSQSSFDGVQKWYDEVHKFCSPLPAVIMCGCKTDQVQRRVVQKEHAEEWAKKHKIAYYEVSAATGENVIKMYDSLLMKVLNKK